ncbi:MAG: FKBP-type peptidyl-prolyl cis-trans isomerase, partial [Gammaproteobacteria bacterium]|nr:FKBP-type peptidyl-prolyl cis-trans isomerase [Gammaproteobacteria bacterium]
MVVAHGRKVTLHYRIVLEDGTEADSTFGEEAETITIGDGTLLPQLEQYLLGLGAGERRSYTLPPESAFGFADSANIHPLQNLQLPDGEVLEPG